MDSGDDFRRTGYRFKVFTNAADGNVYSTVMWFQLTTGHFLQQIRTSLDLARVFTKVQQGTEL